MSIPVQYAQGRTPAVLWAAMRVGFLLVVCLVMLSAAAGAQEPVEAQLRNAAVQFLAPAQPRPLALVVSSMQNCAGCSALAVNTAVDALRTRDTSLVVAVVMIAAEERDVATVRSQFPSAPVVPVVDPAALDYAAAHGAHLPLLLVFDRQGRRIYRHDDLRHSTPDYAGVLRLLAQSPGEGQVENSAALSAQTAAPVAAAQEYRTGGLRLDEPKERSVRHVLSPVLSGTGNRLYCINHLTGAVESWNTATGALLEPIVLPDSVTYFYRRDAADTAWRFMAEQGYSMSRFVALRAVGDTLYGLVTVLAGYDIDYVETTDVAGRVDTVPEMQWRLGQVVVVLAGGVLHRILPLPTEYSLLDLVVADGLIGGPCLDLTGAAADSVVFLALFDAAALHRTTRPVRVWKLPAEDLAVSAGLVCARHDGSLWYCDPGRRVFLHLPREGKAVPMATRGALADCGSPLLLGEASLQPGSAPALPYRLEQLAGGSSRSAILLAPDDPSSGRAHIVQLYDNAGSLTGEHRLDACGIHPTAVVMLIEVYEREAMLLTALPKQPWVLRRVELPVQ